MKPDKSRQGTFVWFDRSGANDATAEALLVTIDGDRLTGRYRCNALVKDNVRKTIPHLDMGLDKRAGMPRAHQIAP